MKAARRIVVRKRTTEPGRRRAVSRLFPAMMAVAAFLMSGTLYALWPRVTVVVSPRASPVRTRAAVLASTAVDVADVDGGRIPAQALKEVIEASVVVPTSGSVSTGITKARGNVVFINEGSRAVTLPAGTLLATPGGARFAILERLVVPASRVRYFMNQAVGIDAGMVETGVEAEEPGSRGNVAAGRITVLVGKQIRGLRLTNPEPLSGGQDKITPVVAEADFEEARARLKSEAYEASSRALLGKAVGDWFVVKETISVDQEEPVFSRAPMAPASELRASCRVHARALAVRNGDMSKVASGQFLLALAGGAQVTSPEVEVEVVESRRADDESAVIEALASATVVPRIKPAGLAMALAGRAVSEARSMLAAATDIATFSLSPQMGDAQVLPRVWWWIRVVVAPLER